MPVHGDDLMAGAAAPPRLALTRVINACVLIQLGDDYVLTDPYFEERLAWLPRMREPFGLRVDELPRLAAVIGGHEAFDHWFPASMQAYPHKDATKVFAANEDMAQRARRGGFTHVERLGWGDTRHINPRLSLRVVPAQKSGGALANNYVLSTEDTRLFVGTEACDIEPLRRYRDEYGPVDVAILPIDESRLFGHKLVMNGRDAIEAAQVLGARALFPIHYSLKPIAGIFQTPWSAEDLLHHAPPTDELEVSPRPTGETWRFRARSSALAASDERRTAAR
jgi:L-ascorbate metabolism protein UlaG (beta-lactamase superfamily)